MKRITLLLFSALCINVVFAQSNNSTNISADDAGWDDNNGTDSPTLVMDIIPLDNNPVKLEKDNAIYDLTGKKIETDDISTLPAGVYIRGGRKFVVQ